MTDTSTQTTHVDILTCHPWANTTRNTQSQALRDTHSPIHTCIHAFKHKGTHMDTHRHLQTQTHTHTHLKLNGALDCKGMSIDVSQTQNQWFFLLLSFCQCLVGVFLFNNIPLCLLLSLYSPKLFRVWLWSWHLVDRPSIHVHAEKVQHLGLVG